jgi:hemoglobin
MSLGQKEENMFTRNTNLWATLGFVAILLAGSHQAVAQSGAQQKQQSLYDRLGGLTPISVVVSDFIDALVPDAVLNANPAIDAAGNVSRRRI